MTSARFAQLTYTSFDGPRAPGGWQVKDVRGELGPEELEFLRARSPTRFDTGEPIPPYPSAEQVQRLPRRLRYGPGPGPGSTAYWHSVPAGPDAAGRPGNVFVHAVLDRGGAAGPPTWPIDLWMSPHWLRPFGAPEVAAASPAEVPDLPWAPIVDRGLVLDFLCADGDHLRRQFLCGLLDAVSAAMRGVGRRVVLGTGSAAEAALWIGAVSHLMSAGTARVFHWAMFGRYADVDVWAGDVHLVAVDRAGPTGPRDPEGPVVLRDDRPVELGDLGGAGHVPESGPPIVVTSWSQIALSVLDDRATAVAVLDHRDRIAADVGDTGLDPAWSLAMAVGATDPRPDGPAAGLGDARELARDPVTTASPPRIRGVPDAHAIAIDLAAADVAPDPAAARAAAAAAPAGIGRLLLEDRYLTLAVRDHEWLTRPGTVWVPTGADRRDRPGAEVLAAVRAALAALDDATRTGPSGTGRGGTGPSGIGPSGIGPSGIGPSGIGPSGIGRSDTDPVGTALLVVRLLDVGRRAHALDADRAVDLADRLVQQVLADERQGPALVARVGPVDQHTLEAFLRPTARRRLRDPGMRPSIPLPVLDWLAPPAPATAAAALGDPLLVEVVGRAFPEPDPAARRTLAVLVALGAGAAARPGPGLVEPARGVADPARVELLLGAPETWTAGQVRELVAAAGMRPELERLGTVVLLVEPAGPDLDALVAAVRDRAPGGALTHAAELRVRVEAWWEGGPEPVMVVLDPIREILAAVARPDPELRAAVLAAHLARAVRRPAALRPDDPLHRLLAETAASRTGAARAAEMIGACVEHQRLTDAELVAAALRTSPAAPASMPRVDGPATVVDPGAPERGTVLDRAVRLRVLRGGPADAVDAAVHQIVRDLPGGLDRRATDRAADEIAEFARWWWARLSPHPAPRPSRFRFGATRDRSV